MMKGEAVPVYPSHFWAALEMPCMHRGRIPPLRLPSLRKTQRASKRVRRATCAGRATLIRQLRARREEPAFRHSTPVLFSQLVFVLKKKV